MSLHGAEAFGGTAQDWSKGQRKPARADAGGGGKRERADSIDGALNKEHVDKNDTNLAQKLKAAKGSDALYPREYRDYEKYEVRTADFKQLPLLTPKWNILAIDQTTGCGQSAVGNSNCVIVYAANKGDELSIQLFSLEVEEIMDADEDSDNEELKMLAYGETLEAGSAFKPKTSSDAKRALVQIGKEKGRGSRDQYVALKLVQITRNQVMTVLQTREGHLDIMGDLLVDESELPDRFTDKLATQQRIQGQIKEVVFGAEKVHVLFQQRQGSECAEALVAC